MGVLTQFPETYPYVSAAGVEYTEEDLEYLVKEMKLFLGQKRLDPDNFNLDIAEVLLRTMEHYDPKFGVPCQLYAKLALLKQVYRSRKYPTTIVMIDGKRVEVPVREVALNDDMQTHSQDLPNYKDDLYDIMKYVGRTLGPQYEKLIRLRMLGYSEDRVARHLEVCRRTVTRMFGKIKAEVERFIND